MTEERLGEELNRMFPKNLVYQLQLSSLIDEYRESQCRDILKWFLIKDTILKDNTIDERVNILYAEYKKRLDEEI